MKEKLNRFFMEYKKSINWVYFFGWCVIFNFGLLFDNWTILNFIMLNTLFLFISIAVYIKWKYKLPL
jgi:hypothetical protein